MREILFKAKRLDNGEWVEGYYIYHIKRTICPLGDSVKSEDEQHVIMRDGFSDWNMPRNTVVYEIDPDTLCQYTGLTDKNGKRIWENDIVRFQFDNDDCPFPNKDTKKRLGKIFFSDFRASWSIAMGRKGNKRINNDLFKYVQNGNRVEVIGNIFDNPELLEGERC